MFGDRRQVPRQDWKSRRFSRGVLGALGCLTGLLMNAGPAAAAPVDGVSVQPSWGGAPGQAKVQTLLGFTAQAALFCCLFAVLAGGAALAIGRITGSMQAGNRGAQLVFGGGGGALIIKFAPGIINWLMS